MLVVTPIFFKKIAGTSIPGLNQPSITSILNEEWNAPLQTAGAMPLQIRFVENDTRTKSVIACIVITMPAPTQQMVAVQGGQEVPAGMVQAPVQAVAGGATQIAPEPGMFDNRTDEVVNRG